MDRDLKFLLQQIAWTCIGTVCGLAVLLGGYLVIPLETVGPFAAVGLAFIPAFVSLGAYALLGWRGTR